MNGPRTNLDKAALVALMAAFLFALLSYLGAEESSVSHDTWFLPVIVALIMSLFYY